MRRRTIEIKHGRVSMIACLGCISPECVRFPGFQSPSGGISFGDVPNSLSAFSKMPGVGWAQIILFCGFVELAPFQADPASPGDFEKAGIVGVPNASGPMKDAEVQVRE